MKQWWKETVFYQIYMPSFCDGNHDGIGDFKGIQSKLEYLKQLGIGAIWLTPFYPSPKVDQGYDISDYYAIDKDYGSMEDFENFIEEAHQLGIKVIADVVINHTSTKHPWFIESSSSVENSKRNWYIWKPPVNGREPNNWESFFGEKAWEYDEATNMYYYHSFAKEQVDLNWANEEVKEEIFHMLDFWIEKGLDGFRLDVINNLTLTDCMKDNPIGEDGKQIHKYDVNQEGIHTFMKELKEHLNKKKTMFLVGEISSDVLDMIHSFTEDGQLDTTFNFNLGSIDIFDFDKIYNELDKMTKLYQQENYPTIFFGSHDMARFASRFQFDEQQIRNLFTLMFTYKAIPFLYFGDEIGMKDFICHDISEARDIQGIIAYKKAKESGETEEEAIKILNQNSRDHGRNTMYWDRDCMYGGFSDMTPWIGYQQQEGLSVKEQMKEKESLLHYVIKLIQFRKYENTLVHGECQLCSPKEQVIVCERKQEGERIVSIINFSEEEINLPLKAEWIHKKIQVLIETNKNVITISKKGVCLLKKSSAVLKLEG